MTVTSIGELLPTIAALSHADKFKLVQLVLRQLAEEDGIEMAKPHASDFFNPHRFFGAAQQPK